MQNDEHPWKHTPRVRFTPQQVAKLFLERHGCCRECGRKLGPSDSWIVEHVIALENGGTNDLENLGITCSYCKPIKDARDHAQAGKQRRTATNHLVCKPMRKRSALSRKHGMKFNWSLGRYEKTER